jgi:hypothetical protein
MTSGETDLAVLLRSMQPVLHPGVYVFATLKARETLPTSINPIMTFREAEGLTLILPEAEATTRLAEAGLAVNPVSAYFHDHLFVPAERADEALAILQSLAAARS